MIEIAKRLVASQKLDLRAWQDVFKDKLNESVLVEGRNVKVEFGYDDCERCVWK